MVAESEGDFVGFRASNKCSLVAFTEYCATRKRKKMSEPGESMQRLEEVIGSITAIVNAS